MTRTLRLSFENANLKNAIQLADAETKNDRNLVIQNAYLDGYSQVDIASFLKVSKSLISKIIKSGDSFTRV